MNEIVRLLLPITLGLGAATQVAEPSVHDAAPPPAHAAQDLHTHGPDSGSGPQPAAHGPTDPIVPGQAEGTGHVHGGGGERHGIARFIAWLGKFHPMVVHFPIAFVLGAALAELLVLGASASGHSSTARFCLLAAAVTAITAASLGWARAWSIDLAPDMAEAVESHRWVGTATTAWVAVTALCSEVARRRATPSWTRAYRATLLGGAVLVSITGHLGAIVTHGPGYAAW